MKSVKLIANILYYITKIISILYLVTGAYVLGVVLLSKTSSASWIPIDVLSDGSFRIFYPFTRTPFILGEYNNSYLVISIAIILLYGLFLWLLSGVFNAFRQERLFTPKNVSRLKRFYRFNVIIPVLSLLILAIIGYELSDVVGIGFLHLLAGVFAFFMAAIFKQGLVLQEEQDLTL
ncbi:MAG: DUF2975 domain-containing protein [Chitinophagaceae bacterium]